jgi:hypothetical protein
LKVESRVPGGGTAAGAVPDVTARAVAARRVRRNRVFIREGCCGLGWVGWLGARFFSSQEE